MATARRVSPRRLLSLLLMLGCGIEPEPHPQPVIRVQPSFICEGDRYATPILLDCTMSSAETHILPAAQPQEKHGAVSCEWEIRGSAYEVLSGTLTGESLEIALPGDHVAEVCLTVHDSDGNTATATEVIGLFVPQRQPCTAQRDCPADSLCVHTTMGGSCVSPCQTDDDCTAPCTVCSHGGCMPIGAEPPE